MLVPSPCPPNPSATVHPCDSAYDCIAQLTSPTRLPVLAAAMARRENQSDVIAGVDLSGDNNPVAPILINLAQRDTINKSSRFATNALGTMGKVTDILARSPHRSASLAVLVAPDVPAVLIELGYLSNADDARQMNTDAWRARVAGAIANAHVPRTAAPASNQSSAHTSHSREDSSGPSKISLVSRTKLANAARWTTKNVERRPRNGPIASR